MGKPNEQTTAKGGFPGLEVERKHNNAAVPSKKTLPKSGTPNSSSPKTAAVAKTSPKSSATNPSLSSTATDSKPLPKDGVTKSSSLKVFPGAKVPSKTSGPKLPAANAGTPKLATARAVAPKLPYTKAGSIKLAAANVAAPKPSTSTPKSSSTESPGTKVLANKSSGTKVAATKSPGTKATVTKSPGIKKTVPATKSPGAKALATKSPGAKVLATKSPGTKGPTIAPTKSPGTRVPANKSLATKVLETKSPGIKVVVTKSPGTKAPVTKSPGMKVPVTKSPGTKVSVTKSPGTKVLVTKKSPGTKILATESSVTKSASTKSAGAQVSVAKSPGTQAANSTASKLASATSSVKAPPLSKTSGAKLPATQSLSAKLQSIKSSSATLHSTKIPLVKLDSTKSPASSLQSSKLSKSPPIKSPLSSLPVAKTPANKLASNKSSPLPSGKTPITASTKTPGSTASSITNKETNLPSTKSLSVVNSKLSTATVNPTSTNDPGSKISGKYAISKVKAPGPKAIPKSKTSSAKAFSSKTARSKAPSSKTEILKSSLSNPAFLKSSSTKSTIGQNSLTNTIAKSLVKKSTLVKASSTKAGSGKASLTKIAVVKSTLGKASPPQLPTSKPAAPASVNAKTSASTAPSSVKKVEIEASGMQTTSTNKEKSVKSSTISSHLQHHVAKDVDSAISSSQSSNEKDLSTKSPSMPSSSIDTSALKKSTNESILKKAPTKTLSVKTQAKTSQVLQLTTGLKSSTTSSKKANSKSVSTRVSSLQSHQKKSSVVKPSLTHSSMPKPSAPRAHSTNPASLTSPSSIASGPKIGLLSFKASSSKSSGTIKSESSSVTTAGNTKSTSAKSPAHVQKLPLVNTTSKTQPHPKTSQIPLTSQSIETGHKSTAPKVSSMAISSTPAKLLSKAPTSKKSKGTKEKGEGEPKSPAKTSKYVGVTFRPTRVKYQARIYKGNKEYNLGLFDVSADAALAYDVMHRLVREITKVQGKEEEAVASFEANGDGLDWIDLPDEAVTQDQDADKLNFVCPSFYHAAREKELKERNMSPASLSDDPSKKPINTYPTLSELKAIIRKEATRIAKVVIGHPDAEAAKSNKKISTVKTQPKKRKKEMNELQGVGKKAKPRKNDEGKISMPALPDEKDIRDAAFLESTLTTTAKDLVLISKSPSVADRDVLDNPKQENPFGAPLLVPFEPSAKKSKRAKKAGGDSKKEEKKRKKQKTTLQPNPVPTLNDSKVSAVMFDSAPSGVQSISASDIPLMRVTGGSASQKDIGGMASTPDKSDTNLPQAFHDCRDVSDEAIKMSGSKLLSNGMPDLFDGHSHQRMGMSETESPSISHGQGDVKNKRPKASDSKRGRNATPNTIGKNDSFKGKVGNSTAPKKSSSNFSNSLQEFGDPSEKDMKSLEMKQKCDGMLHDLQECANVGDPGMHLSESKVETSNMFENFDSIGIKATQPKGSKVLGMDMPSSLQEHGTFGVKEASSSGSKFPNDGMSSKFVGTVGMQSSLSKISSTQKYGDFGLKDTKSTEATAAGSALPKGNLQEYGELIAKGSKSAGSKNFDNNGLNAFQNYGDFSVDGMKLNNTRSDLTSSLQGFDVGAMLSTGLKTSGTGVSNMSQNFGVVSGEGSKCSAEVPAAFQEFNNSLGTKPTGPKDSRSDMSSSLQEFGVFGGTGTKSSSKVADSEVPNVFQVYGDASGLDARNIFQDHVDFGVKESKSLGAKGSRIDIESNSFQPSGGFGSKGLASPASKLLSSDLGGVSDKIMNLASKKNDYLQQQLDKSHSERGNTTGNLNQTAQDGMQFNQNNSITMGPGTKGGMSGMIGISGMGGTDSYIKPDSNPGAYLGMSGTFDFMQGYSGMNNSGMSNIPNFTSVLDPTTKSSGGVIDQGFSQGGGGIDVDPFNQSGKIESNVSGGIGSSALDAKGQSSFAKFGSMIDDFRSSSKKDSFPMATSSVSGMGQINMYDDELQRMMLSRSLGQANDDKLNTGMLQMGSSRNTTSQAQVRGIDNSGFNQTSFYSDGFGTMGSATGVQQVQNMKTLMQSGNKGGLSTDPQQDIYQQQLAQSLAPSTLNNMIHRAGLSSQTNQNSYDAMIGQIGYDSGMTSSLSGGISGGDGARLSQQLRDALGSQYGSNSFGGFALNPSGQDYGDTNNSKLAEKIQNLMQGADVNSSAYGQYSSVRGGDPSNPNQSSLLQSLGQSNFLSNPQPYGSANNASGVGYSGFDDMAQLLGMTGSSFAASREQGNQGNYTSNSWGNQMDGSFFNAGGGNFNNFQGM